MGFRAFPSTLSHTTMTTRISALRAPRRAAAVTLIALGGCLVDSSKKETTADTTHLAPVVTITPVNRGTHGMAERVMWTFSPDRKSVLVVADPGGVENEPVPNGFFFGDESRGFQTQMDSVWDVAPSPDWKWIGFGRAYTVVGGAGTGTDLLTDVSRRTSIDTATLRAGSFAASGMSMSRAVAQAGVIHIPDNPRESAAADSAAPKLFPVARGWRVRWTADGSTLALGNNPSRAVDNEPSPADGHDAVPANPDPAWQADFHDPDHPRSDHDSGAARSRQHGGAASCGCRRRARCDCGRSVHNRFGAAKYARSKREFG